MIYTKKGVGNEVRVALKGIEPLPPDPNSGILSIELQSRSQAANLQLLSVNHSFQ